MRPKPILTPSAGETDMFRNRLDNMIDMRHELVRLAGLIDWKRFDEAFGGLYAEKKARPCVRRYLAVRIQRRQGSLFADGSSVQYFAVVTNRPEDGLTILRWHREKAGTIEHTHHVLKTELAAAALPSGKFGANAAWFRLNVLTYNLLTALKRLTLPGDLRTARPKRLRFLLFNTVGKVVAHARRTLLRLSGALQHALLVRARRKIARLATA